MMDIMKLVLAQEDFMIRERRYFHVHAEPSAREYRTMEHINGLLTEMGIAHEEIEDGGILGFIEGKKPGKTVLLRADCDGLRIPEKVENLKGPKPCISASEGVCHACGHDGHMAALLGAAKVLSDRKDELRGRVILMFERGEEMTGNVACIHRHMERAGIHVDSAYANHLYSGLPSGQIALLDGPVMSGSMSFRITITGRGGHGSRPDLAVTPIDAFTALYSAMNTLRMKEASPFNAVTFSVGTVHAGTSANAIPDDLTFTGSFRVSSREDGVKIKARLKAMAGSICEAYGCTCTFHTLAGPGCPVVNDRECAALARRVVGDAIGAERIVSCEPWMASESFGRTLAMWPGVFGMVGIANPEVGSGAAHHSGAFDIDEAALKYSAAAYVAYAKGFLDSDLDVSSAAFKGTFAELYRAVGQDAQYVAYMEGKIDRICFGA